MVREHLSWLYLCYLNNESGISLQHVAVQMDRQLSMVASSWMIRELPSTLQWYSQWMRGWIQDKPAAKQRLTLPAQDRKSYHYSVLSLIAQALLRDKGTAESGWWEEDTFKYVCKWIPLENWESQATWKKLDRSENTDHTKSKSNFSFILVQKLPGVLQAFQISRV